MTTPPGRLFTELVPFFILEIDHAAYSRFEETPFGKWDVWMNVINVEADRGTTEKALFGAFYGAKAAKRFLARLISQFGHPRVVIANTPTRENHGALQIPQTSTTVYRCPRSDQHHLPSPPLSPHRQISPPR